MTILDPYAVLRALLAAIDALSPTGGFPLPDPIASGGCRVPPLLVYVALFVWPFVPALGAFLLADRCGARRCTDLYKRLAPRRAVQILGDEMTRLRESFAAITKTDAHLPARPAPAPAPAPVYLAPPPPPASHADRRAISTLPARPIADPEHVAAFSAHLTRPRSTRPPRGARASEHPTTHERPIAFAPAHDPFAETVDDMPTSSRSHAFADLGARLERVFAGLRLLARKAGETPDHCRGERCVIDAWHGDEACTCACPGCALYKRLLVQAMDAIAPEPQASRSGPARRVKDSPSEGGPP